MDMWDHTSTLMATIVNANPFRSGKIVHPSAFNPFHNRKKKAAADDSDVLKVPLKECRDLFIR